MAGSGYRRESSEAWPRGSAQGAECIHQRRVSPGRDLWELPAKVVMMEGRGKKDHGMAHGSVWFVVSAGIAGSVGMAENPQKDTRSFGKKINYIG